MDGYAKEYEGSHLMAASVSRMIKDGEMIIVGIGLPLIAAAIARLGHAPNSTTCFEVGCIGTNSKRMPWSVADSACSDHALASLEMWRMLSDVQRGFIDVGVIGGAQVDRYGNLNSTVITGSDGSYYNPKIRMPGSGGSNDIASSCRRTIIMMRLQEKKFVKNIDYMTSVGHLKGWDSREKAGLLGTGPEAVVTDKAIFRFDSTTKEMYLSEISQYSTIEEVVRLVDWDLKISPDVTIMKPPTKKEMNLMLNLDSAGVVLGSGIRLDDFDKYIKSMMNVYHLSKANVFP